MKQITTPDTRATHEDSRADSKTVWTVTEDEELFKKEGHHGGCTSGTARCSRPQFNPVFTELAAVRGLVVRGSCIAPPT